MRHIFLTLSVSVGTLLCLSADQGKPPVQFSEHLLLDDYGYAYGIAAADLDGDGDLDLVSSETTKNHLYWFENDGKGNFRKRFIMKDEPGWFERNAVGDINGDGKPDVVVVKNQAGDIVWFENNGTPGDDKLWKRHVIIKGGLPGAYDVALADLDGDGLLDVAASSWVRGKQFCWFKNPGKDGFDKEWPRHLIEDNLLETRTIRVADINGDGKPDLLGTASSINLIVWYENPGKPATGPWKKHVIDDKSPRPIHGHAIDFDKDGDIDVVMALGMLAKDEKETNQVVWYENVGKKGQGTEWKKHVIGKLPGAFEAFAADLDGDGHLDVAATAWAEKPMAKLVWFHNPGDASKENWPMYVVKDQWARANQVIVADLDGDRRPDIAACAERGANELRWWRNQGKK